MLNSIKKRIITMMWTHGIKDKEFVDELIKNAKQIKKHNEKNYPVYFK